MADPSGIAGGRRHLRRDHLEEHDRGRSASCTVTAKASNNGIRYRCVVTNSYGSVTSSPAKLTVS